MKVRVSLTVDLDAEAWAEEYGLEKSEVREDFSAWARNAVLVSTAEVGCLL